MNLGSVRIISILVLLALIVQPAASQSSNWNLKVLGGDYSPDVVRDDQESIRLVNLTGDVDSDPGNEPINQTTLENDDATLNYIYNATGGSRKQMSYLTGGTYYFTLTPNSSKEYIEYELRDDSSDGFEENKTVKLGFGNVSTNLTTDMSGMFRAGETVNVKVNLTDKWNNENIDGSEGTVNAYFTNGSWTSSKNELGYSSGVHRLNMNIPDTPGKRYVFVVNGKEDSASYKRPNSTTSRIVNIYDAVDGKLETFKADSGCDSQTSMSTCEPGATLEAEVNITSSTAEKVNMTVWRHNGSEISLADSTEMTEDNGLYTGSLDVPVINLSKYDANFTVKFNASNSGRSWSTNKTIDYRQLAIRDKSSPTAFQGGDYRLEILFAKYFSLTPYTDEEMMNATVEIDYPNGTSFKDFNLSEMKYRSSEDLFTNTVSIPITADTGSYSVDIGAYTQNFGSATRSSAFSVENLTATFNLSDNEIEFDINRTGSYMENLTLTNKVSSSNTLNVSMTDSIRNITEVNNGTDIQLSNGEKINLPFDFNITRVEDYSGEVILEDKDSNYSETVDIDIDAPSCEMRNGTLCLEDTERVDVSSSEKGHTSRLMQLIYLGEKNGSEDIEVTIEGNISEHLEIDPSEFELNDSKIVTLNYSVSRRGYFNGTLTLTGAEDSLKVETSLNSDIPVQDTGLSANTSSISLGSVPSGGSKKAKITVENTGSVETTGVEATSTSMTVSSNEFSLQPNESRTLEISFSDIQSGFGTVTVEGNTSNGAVSVDISVSADVLENYADKTSELETRISDLQQRTDDSELASGLENQQLRVNEISAAWDNGNYEEAKQIYDDIQSELDTIEAEIVAAEQEEQSPSPTPGTQDPSPDTEEGGGFPILLVLILAVVLGAGFIAATSLELEPGDPLYDLLGE